MGDLDRPESLTNIPAPTAQSEIRRRVIYLMMFRLVLISLVLGSTLLIWWVTDADISSASSIAVFVIIGATYLLTVIYGIALQRGVDPGRLGELQTIADLITTTLLVHVTGGAKSAYTFFFALSIIGAATIRFRRGAVITAIASAVLFTGVSLLAWSGLVPEPSTLGIPTAELRGIELARYVGLNLATFAGVGFLAVNLGQQIQQTVASLESEREAAADLYTLHEDIVRCLSSGLITIDERDRVLTINRAACELLRTQPARTVGRPLELLLPGIGAKLARLPRRGSLRRGDLVTRRGDEKIVVGLSVSPLRDNADRVIGRVLNFSDLTELRTMEKQVKHAERLAAIGTLAAGIAHEIRNPLASISGSIELMTSAPDQDNRPLMRIVTREIDRLNVMISDLLDYANPGPRELVEFDVAALVHETVHVFEQDHAFDGVELRITDDSLRAGLLLTGDAGRIRQVFWNLLRNAAQAATDGGANVVVHISEAEGYAVIEVRDDGPGMSADQISQVFDPFFTTKKGGSGLGLATSHNIITEHGGSIEARSPEGDGARFVVRLPLETTGTFAEWRKDRPVPAYTRSQDE